VNRISWNDFFNHKVFSETFDIPQCFENLIEGLEKTAENVENEFKNNRQSIGKDKDEEVLPDPLNLYTNQKQSTFTAQTVDETIGAQSSFSGHFEDHFKEYTYRYYHEKNKILVIYMTVRKLRQLIKEKDFASQQKTIYLLMIVLARKGIELSEFTIRSLTHNNNIFHLDYFDEFCEHTSQFKETLQQFEEDRKMLNDYQNFILSLKPDIHFNDSEQEIFDFCSKAKVDLNILDKNAMQLFKKFRKFEEPPALSQSIPARHAYLIAMVFTVYSICNDAYLPYQKLDGSKFEWEIFKQNHEELDCTKLSNLLDKLDK